MPDDYILHPILSPSAGIITEHGRSALPPEAAKDGRNMDLRWGGTAKSMWGTLRLFETLEAAEARVFFAHQDTIYYQVAGTIKTLDVNCSGVY